MKRVVFPKECAVEEWWGFKRHKFQFQGCDAWIAEPHVTAGDGRWSWCMVWPEAFVPRVGIVSLLEHGFYHVHIDTFATRANKEGIRIMREFHDMLVGMGLSPKANLIAMSWGGYFSLRYSEENPDRIAAIYLDAPVCNAADTHPSAADRLELICQQWNMGVDEIKASILNPLNNVKAIADAKIPVFAIISGADDVVIPDLNFGLLEAEFGKLGVPVHTLADKDMEQILKGVQPGNVYVLRRRPWAHHPHGLDNVTPLMHCTRSSGTA